MKATLNQHKDHNKTQKLRCIQNYYQSTYIPFCNAAVVPRKHASSDTEGLRLTQSTYKTQNNLSATICSCSVFMTEDLQTYVHTLHKYR